jgi:hypothetical protein
MTDDQGHGTERPAIHQQDIDPGAAHQVLCALVESVVDSAAEQQRKQILGKSDPEPIAADMLQKRHRCARLRDPNGLAEGAPRVRECAGRG